LELGVAVARDVRTVPIEAVAENVGDGVANRALVVRAVEGQVEEGESHRVHVHVSNGAVGAPAGGAGGGIVGFNDVGEAGIVGGAAGQAFA
jgi:hypothetical protein